MNFLQEQLPVIIQVQFMLMQRALFWYTEETELALDFLHDRKKRNLTRAVTRVSILNK